MPRPSTAVQPGENRTVEQLREQYLLESELAQRLRTATKEERRSLYSTVYEELYARVPHHPGHSRQCDPRQQAVHVAAQFRFIKDFLKPDDSFLEVGAGDGRLAMEVAKHVRKVVAVDVSDDRIDSTAKLPPNFEMLVNDGIDMNLPPASFNLAFSFQVIEHLHEEDAQDQLRAIYQALAPGGTYVCVTPHLYMGPSDISRYFALTPQGMHLKEYTNGQLRDAFRRAGFSGIRSRVSLKWMAVMLPVWPIMLFEHMLGMLPVRLRRLLACSVPLRNMLSICLVGRK